MGGGLSIQQKSILKILFDEEAHYIEEFKHLYTNCNLYRALDNLIERELIKKIGKKYYITNKGHTLTLLLKLGFGD